MYKLDKQASFMYVGEADIGAFQTGSGVVNSFNADNNALGTPEGLGDLVNISAFTSGSGAAVISGSAGSGSDAYGRILPPTANLDLFVASV